MAQRPLPALARRRRVPARCGAVPAGRPDRRGHPRPGRALRERTKKLAELQEQLDWLAAGTVEIQSADLAKHGLPASDARTALEAFAKNLEQVDPFEQAQITATLDRVVADLGFNRRRSFMTARLALVGKPVSPPLDDTMAALGVRRTVERLRQAAAAIEG
ncbi:hypothetical protein [Dactylosporangium darangshiense]|uniref:hypothetical protein n=1 Tax=Dactylosporangium darangshiense TaxID=579108 RepID=UPI00363A0AD0